MDVSEDLDWRLELDEWFLVLKHLLCLLDQKLDHFVRQVHEWDVLGVLRPVSDDVVVEVVYNNVHDETHLIM